MASRLPAALIPVALVSLLAPFALLGGLLGCRPAPPAPPSPEFARAMNLGKAHLENKEADDAVAAFARAVEIEPASAPALRNLARAELLARQHGEALATLDRARKIEPDSTATAYLTGIAHARESRFVEAIPLFEQAVRLDPASAPLRFQLAGAYEATDQRDRAAEQLREAVRLDPLHASAHFKLATAARLAGDRETFDREQREFMRLRELQGDEARSAEALEVSAYTRAEPAGAVPRAGAAEPGAPVTFADVTASLPAEARAATAAAVLEVDAAGRATVLLAGPGGLALLRPAAGGGFGLEKTDSPNLSAAGNEVEIEQIEIGDFFDEVPDGETFDPAVHARNDALLLGPATVRLLQRTAAGGFADVTERAGLAGLVAQDGRAPAAALWVDADHDGDLDLLTGGEAGLRLHQNRGDGTFIDAGEAMGIAAPGPVADLAAADLDGNVAIDLVVARGAGASTTVLVNQRAGTYAPLPEPPGPWPPARRVLLDDLDGDGAPEALLLGDGEATLVPLGRAGRRGVDLAAAGAPKPPAPAAATLLDFDNDGRLDLAVAPAGGGLRLWRNRGGAESATFAEVTAEAGLAAVDLPAPLTGTGPAAGRRALLAADLDGDGDTDLLLATAGGLRLLDNRGGDAHRQLKVRLVGTKTNPTGIGTHVEVRAGTFLAAREVAGPVIEIGLGEAGKEGIRLDSVQTVWTNGVVDNQIDVDPAAGPLTVVEKVVATGSCPFLYAWDGQRFRFVTDLLGNSPLGLVIARGVTLPADPDELVTIGGEGTLRPRDGDYVFEVTSEFREVVYLDQARLVAVDHPPEVAVEPTDKIRPPPYPPSEVWALTAMRRLRAATDADGHDLTAELADRDGVFADAGPRLPPPLRGMTRPHSIVLDFGPLATAVAGVGAKGPMVLALTGWLQYGDGSANIAVSQNPSLTVVPPTLEAETAPGRWRPVDVVVGMPAGKTKTILVDLAGRLPAATRRLRLTTTFEIRWDAIALGERVARSGSGSAGSMGASLIRHDLAATGADLYRRGFSDLRARALLHPTTPDYAQVAARPPWRTTPRGWSTRYGEVRDLLATRDGQMVIINSGDALRLTFPAAALPPVPPGMQRTFFFYSVGWDKDADPNNTDGDTVEPLPAEADLTGDWWLRYNTRWVPADLFYPAGGAGD